MEVVGDGHFPTLELQTNFSVWEVIGEKVTETRVEKRIGITLNYCYSSFALVYIGVE